MAPRPDNTGKGPPEASLGFEMVERLVAEYRRSGRVPTLERWLTQCGQRLTQYCEAHPSAAAKREATVVAHGLELARELVEQLATTPPARR